MSSFKLQLQFKSIWWGRNGPTGRSEFTRQGRNGRRIWSGHRHSDVINDKNDIDVNGTSNVTNVHSVTSSSSHVSIANNSRIHADPTTTTPFASPWSLSSRTSGQRCAQHVPLWWCFSQPSSGHRSCPHGHPDGLPISTAKSWSRYNN